MPERSFARPREEWTLFSPVGDVLAARAAACAMLTADPELADDAFATLLLTAAIVVVVTLTGGEARQRDLVQALAHLRQAEEPGCAFSRSSSQFVRYAAAELQHSARARRDRVLEQLSALLEAGRPAAGGDPRPGMVGL